VEPDGWRRHRTRLETVADDKPAARANSRFDGLSPVAARQVSQFAFQPPRHSQNRKNSSGK
jgi:hypothetical protein